MRLLEKELFCPGYIEIVIEGPGYRRFLKIDNLVVAEGRNLISRFLAGDNVTGSKYLALGTGSTPVNDMDTRLEAEVFRKAHTQKDVFGTTVRLTTFLTTSEANGINWRELGLFGNGATSSPNTGTLIARATTDFSKTADESITITWNIPIKVR